MTTWTRVEAAMMDGLREDAERDRAEVTAWDATLPPLPDHHCPECCTLADCPRCWPGPDEA
jgi:hypothetical protein